MRIVYMGTGEIGLPTLRRLAESGPEHELVGVFTGPDKRVGRKQTLTPPAVKTLATDAGVPVFQPESLRKNDEALGALTELRPDLVVVMAYGQILPRAVIEAPATACVNLHASLLPRHRGASPIQAAIREGDEETGITLIHVVPKLDAGDMILRERIPIDPADTGGTLHERLAELGPRIIDRALPRLARGETAGEPQDESLVTQAGKLEREDGRIDWSHDATRIERTLRAYDPWPGAFTEAPVGEDRRKLKLFPPTRVESAASTAAPGAILAAGDDLLVQCGRDGLALTGDLQLEGRRRLPVGELQRGVELPVGAILGSGGD